jgi:hypothetical protein
MPSLLLHQHVIHKSQQQPQLLKLNLLIYMFPQQQENPNIIKEHILGNNNAGCIYSLNFFGCRRSNIRRGADCQHSDRSNRHCSLSCRWDPLPCSSTCLQCVASVVSVVAPQQRSDDTQQGDTETPQLLQRLLQLPPTLLLWLSHHLLHYLDHAQ